MSQKARLITRPARAIPAKLLPAVEVFAIGDIHGRAAALHGCLNAIREFPKDSTTHRVVIFLGDLIDRGPDSLGVLKMISEATMRTNADEVHLLPGNHEMMMLDFLDQSSSLWLMNGGATVLDELQCDWRNLRWSKIVPVLRAALPEGFEAAIREAPSHLSLGDLLFVHAGLNPNQAPELQLQKGRSHEADPLHWAWVREPFLTWSGGWTWSGTGSKYFWGDTIVVHGHTPAVEGSLSVSPDHLAKCDNVASHRRVCLDAGASIWDQIAWAHFSCAANKTEMRLSATVIT